MFYQKTGGSWVYRDGRPYIRRAGTGWTPIVSGYVKRSGVWTNFYTFDATPPAAPTLTVAEEITTFQQGGTTQRGRHVLVTVKPSVADTSVRRVRLLVSPVSQPTSQYDQSGYISAPETAHPTEPWSELYYNGYNGYSRLSTAADTRVYTRDATDQTVVPAGTFYFSAWSEDFAGNWSPGAFKTITLTSFSTALPSFNSRITATGTGTLSQQVFTSGDVRQAGTPRENGYFFYGSQLFQELSKATDPKITSAQIFLHRKNDSGQDNANIYLAWHDHTSRSDFPNNPNFDGNTVTKVGTIAKGEAKWFDIPSTHWDNIANRTLKGFCLGNRLIDDDPDTDATAKDFSVLKSLTDAPRSGELYITFNDQDG